MTAAGMISDDDLGLFGFAETAEEVWGCLIEGGLALPD